MTPLYCEKEKALESQEETPDSCSSTYASLIGLIITGTRFLKQKGAYYWLFFFSYFSETQNELKHQSDAEK